MVAIFKTASRKATTHGRIVSNHLSSDERGTLSAQIEPVEAFIHFGFSKQWNEAKQKSKTAAFYGKMNRIFWFNALIADSERGAALSASKQVSVPHLGNHRGGKELKHPAVSTAASSSHYYLKYRASRT